MQQKKQKGEDAKKTSLPDMPDEEGLYGSGTGWFFERKCPQCGGRFCMPDREMWAYKDGYTILCSWRCLRAREKQKQLNAAEKKGKKAGNIRLKPEVKVEMIRMIKKGVKPAEIDVKLGVPREVVWYYQRKLREKGEL